MLPAMRLFRPLTRIVLVALVAAPALLFALQDKMIYHPRHYPRADAAGVAVRPHGIGRAKAPEPLREKVRRETGLVESIAYATSQGAQQCYYEPPAAAGAGGVPAKLWVLFNGNGSLALEWLYVLEGYPGPADGFLLVEYPGYGACAGHPSPGAIQESADAALAALGDRLGLPQGGLEPRLEVLGHSLGCAAALGFATRHPGVSHVVLLAPFTSMADMARRTVGWPLCLLLTQHYDNRARMGKIAARAQPPRVDILSGTGDDLIPFTMGRELAGLAPGVAHFQPVEGAGHSNILDRTGLIHSAMTGQGGPGR